jgi:hypothetical protein
VRLGTGKNRGQVYTNLEPKGLMVLGGRVSVVGVGGFLLGGKLVVQSSSFDRVADFN